MLHNIFSKNEVSLDDVIAAFGAGITSVTLGFAPADPSGWQKEDYHEEDCNFFVKGDFFEVF